MTSPQWQRQVVCRPHEQETVRSSVGSGRRACPRGHRVGAGTNLPTAATPPSCRHRRPRRAQNARERLENRASASTGIGLPPQAGWRAEGKRLGQTGVGAILFRPPVDLIRQHHSLIWSLIGKLSLDVDDEDDEGSVGIRITPANPRSVHARKAAQARWGKN
jgi:hypothetical protein